LFIIFSKKINPKYRLLHYYLIDALLYYLAEGKTPEGICFLLIANIK